MRVAPPILLTDEQRRRLSAAASSRSLSVRFAQRARMILLATQGRQDKQIAAEVGIRRQSVALWRRRFLQLGIDGIAKDAPRGGRKRSARSDAKVRALIHRTTQTTPPDATHWSTRSMARAAGTSEATVRRVWHEHGLKPHRVKLSALDGKLIGTCMKRHRHQEWIKFLTLIDQQTPAEKQLHLVVD